MSKLALTITQAGHSRFTAAQVDDDIDLSISAVGLSDRAFVAAPTLTALPGEFRRVSTISGEAIGDNVVHMVVRDADPLAYTVRGFGLFLADGTLFATFAHAGVLFEKSALSDMHLAIDIAFPTGNVEQLTFGDTNFLNPPATTATRGVVELATQEEVDAGEDAERVVTPRTLTQRLGGWAGGLLGRRITGSGLATGGGDLTADRTITVPAASAAEADAGTIANKALTPASIVNLITSIAARVPLTRRIDTAGLALGGGALGTDQTISVPAATPEQLLNAMASNVAVTPASFGGLASLLGPSGHYTLPGGLLIKWGTVAFGASSGAATSGSFAFAEPFPNTCFGAVGNFSSNPGGADLFFPNRTATTLWWVATAAAFNGSDMPAASFFWIAVGN